VLGDFVPSLGWVVLIMASVAKIAAPVLLVDKFVRTPSLLSFCDLDMSPKDH
jgi:hypothetical protein